jgi:hypothetical protein
MKKPNVSSSTVDLIPSGGNFHSHEETQGEIFQYCKLRSFILQSKRNFHSIVKKLRVSCNTIDFTAQYFDLIGISIFVKKSKVNPSTVDIPSIWWEFPSL